MAGQNGSRSKLYRIFFQDQTPTGGRQRTQFSEPSIQQPEYQPAPTVLENEYQPSQPEYQPPQQQEIFCTACGRKNESMAVYCIGCGTNLF